MMCKINRKNIKNYFADFQYITGGGRHFAKNRFFLKKMFYRFVAESLRNGKIRSVFFIVCV